MFTRPWTATVMLRLLPDRSTRCRATRGTKDCRAPSMERAPSRGRRSLAYARFEPAAFILRPSVIGGVMRGRILQLMSVTAMIGVAAVASVGSQTPVGQTGSALKTSWGEPDLQGTWS